MKHSVIGETDIQILHNFRPSVRGVKKNLNTNTKYHQNHILTKPCFMQISSMNNLLKWKNIVFHVRLLFPPCILSLPLTQYDYGELFNIKCWVFYSINSARCHHVAPSKGVSAKPTSPK